METYSTAAWLYDIAIALHERDGDKLDSLFDFSLEVHGKVTLDLD